jgi:hypothetical protein
MFFLSEDSKRDEIEFLSTVPDALAFIFLLVILNSCWIRFWPFGVLD